MASSGLSREWGKAFSAYIVIIVSLSLGLGVTSYVRVRESQRDGCERANHTLRPDMRFILAELRDLSDEAAPSLSPAFQYRLQLTLPGIQRRITENANRDCEADYSIP